MSLIIRIDVDRAYGRQGLIRHVASRISSDFSLPRIESLHYLDELKVILRILNSKGKPAIVFFRKCTYPTSEVCRLMEAGGHQFGLHLENSRSAETFREELESLASFLQKPVAHFSKHGSGRLRLGRHHYAPYEPERYLPWARQCGLKYFFGNLENPEWAPVNDGGVVSYPAAFWLEPHWRDTAKYPIQWLLNEARRRDVVLLLHPDNVTASPDVMREFLIAIDSLDTVVLADRDAKATSSAGLCATPHQQAR